jgi:hypothetical protein
MIEGNFGILVHICHLILTFLDFRIEELGKLIRNSNITFYLLMKNSCTLASLTKIVMVIEQRPAWKIIHGYLFAYQCFCCLV